MPSGSKQMPSGSKQGGEAEVPSLAHGEADSAAMLCVLFCAGVLCVLCGTAAINSVNSGVSNIYGGIFHQGPL